MLLIAAPVPKEKALPFAIVSVSYTDVDNKPQTARFEQARAVPPLEEPPGKLRATIGASTVRNAIVISGIVWLVSARVSGRVSGPVSAGH